MKDMTMIENEMIEFKYKCYDYTHPTHKWGIEYSNDADGNDIIEVEWFTTESDRDQAMKGQTK
jgi:hypothetical protein